ncbi:aminoglycoside phosphotransferase family protein [Streptomyces sp. 15-116A]|uniref:aminoglycoside phosphotransferase family protein n=1 Tax=Streptomyces sp. 15-116A TaxID=2259035 RepID=UPI0021B4372E|nr:aminoglycoside phosphotransferase family protein [Streptomyces sp. 15-116A]MCT7351670.1 aminoglycoside phosphotransferase family protein [Streptomyces sp. 15-116A]
MPGAAFRAFAYQAAERGVATNGHHNRNYVLPLTEREASLLGREPGTSVTVRVRRVDALRVVIRTWPDEAEILRAIKGVLPHVPECLVQDDGFSILSYVEGVPLSSVCGNGKPLDTLLIQALARMLAQMSQVRRAALPPLPPVWPRNDTDSQGFLRTLAYLADQQIRQPNWSAFGGLFAALGIPGTALLEFADRVPAMARRPYSLLHADLHRDNLIVSYAGEQPLICVDWELATYGDPLHDLATHLVRMRYPAHRWLDVVEAWAVAMQSVRPAALNSFSRDLPHYIAFERAQSVFPDVIRAARSLEDSFTQKSLDEATAEVRRALEVAAGPLRLTSVPGEKEIEGALFRWLASRAGRGHSKGLVAKAFAWQPDRRLPLPADFSDTAVREALALEGAAPASRVFKGTAHLNTVVRVPSIDTPLVVRRRLAEACRRERSFLSEHAVLRAIEEAPVAVAAPRALALGVSYPDDPFAVHTYVGPDDTGRPPNHPVRGLLPHEADGLVDQLCALTRVDYRQLDPLAWELAVDHRFFHWLKDQLVALVTELPKKSQQLARHLGLPDAHRLAQILSRHEVSNRAPSLLHGDLNPWNLVRRDDALAVTIIDWEMALVGDPLYDLVRHMHLTPTRPEIRDRMFRRWERLLPPEYTRDWRKDWQLYRSLEIVRSAYVDLDRIVTGAGMDAPNVQRAVDSYPVTLAVATGFLGLPVRSTVNPYLARALV